MPLRSPRLMSRTGVILSTARDTMYVPPLPFSLLFFAPQLKYINITLVWQLWYAYAKTLAEKEAWRLAKEENIDLVVVNPSFVVGPLITPQPTSTLQMILSIVKGFTC